MEQRWFRDTRTGQIRQAETGQCVLLGASAAVPIYLGKCPSGQAETLSFHSERLTVSIFESIPKFCAEEGEICDGCKGGIIFYGKKYSNYGGQSPLASFSQMKSDPKDYLTTEGR